MAVHRNNVIASLTEALRASFPAVSRVLDPRFFDYAAQCFIRAHPPQSPCLADYGAELPRYLAEFPACRHLAYLHDLAQLEWLVARASCAPDLPARDNAILTQIAAEDAPLLIFEFHPAFGWIESPWSIARIWEANAKGSGDSEIIAANDGGVRLEISRKTGSVLLRQLDRASFDFRTSLANKATLERAAESALAVDPFFDLAISLATLFRDGAVIGLSAARK